LDNNVMLKSRKPTLLFVVVLLVVMTFVLVKRHPRANEGPSYDGRTLGDWLIHVDGLSSHPDRDSPIFLQASNAIVQIGTNGLLFLLESIRYEPSRPYVALGTLAEEVVSHLPDALTPYSFLESTRRSSRPYRAEAAVVAFQLLGPTAESCADELSTIVRDATSERLARRATRALAALGANAYPHLRTIALNTNGLGRSSAIHGMRFMGTNTAAAVPVLVELLDDPGPYVCESAVGALGTIRLSPEVAVPALARILQHPDAETRSLAAWALGRFGTNAVVAVPALQAALEDPQTYVRDAASNSLQVITARVATKAVTQ
jgi:HEAT repeat protein